jgi:hypothetical protein
MVVSQIHGESVPATGTVVEVLGTANTSASVDPIRFVDLGSEFKLDKYDTLVQAIHGQQKALFQ